jgi:DNA topoisomerase IA
LQRDANKRYGLTAKQTLDAAQVLYERHKLLTYPGTDSRHLTTSLAGTLYERIRARSLLCPAWPRGRRWHRTDWKSWMKPPGRQNAITKPLSLEQWRTPAATLKEKGGIGTPATRAAIIERLIQVGYVVRDKKDLVPTAKGEALIALVDEQVKSPELTARWEQQLVEVECGSLKPAMFWSGIVDMTREIIQTVKGQAKTAVPVMAGAPASPRVTKAPGKPRGKQRTARRK